MKPLFLIGLIVLLPALPLQADKEPPRFIVNSVDGTAAPGPLVTLADDWTCRCADGRLIPGSQLISLEHATLPRPAALDNQFLLLTNGDRIPIDPRFGLKIDDELLFVSPAAPLDGSKDIAVPIHFCQVLWRAAPGKVRLKPLLNEIRKNDVVYLANGDRLEGDIQGGPRGLQLKTPDRVRDLNSFAVLAFSAEQRGKPRSRGPLGHVVLAGGARIGLSRLRLQADKNQLAGQTLFGAALTFPLDQLRALDIRQGAAVYLSDLKPAAYENKPFLGVTWPLVGDANTQGGPLQLSENTFDKGLGMHGHSQVTYALNGTYRWFEALVGADENVGVRARYRVKVLVDGKAQKLEGADERSHRDEPLRLRVDVRNARTLTLEVPLGDFGDVDANIDWANARLIK